MNSDLFRFIDFRFIFAEMKSVICVKLCFRYKLYRVYAMRLKDHFYK